VGRDGRTAQWCVATIVKPNYSKSASQNQNPCLLNQLQAGIHKDPEWKGSHVSMCVVPWHPRMAGVQRGQAVPEAMPPVQAMTRVPWCVWGVVCVCVCAV